MSTFEVPKEVLELAMSIVYSRLQDYPENEWTSVGHNFELNMFIQKGEFKHQYASLYRNIDGEIDTQNFVRIWDQHIVDDEYNQFVQEQNAQMEADWLARNEPPFADRALDEAPDDVDFDGLITVYGEYDTSSEPLGLTYSRLNPHGVFTPDGRQIGSICGCEDYPCCGH